MPHISLARAKELNLVTDKELERLLQVFLAMCDEAKPSATAMQAAASESGTAVASYRRMFNATVAKLKDGACVSSNDGEVLTPSKAAVSTPKGKAGRKRKNVDMEEGGATKKKSKHKEDSVVGEVKLEDDEDAST